MSLPVISLYNSTETAFTTSGIVTLDPISCDIEERAGGLYELTLVQPMNDKRHEQLICGRIITAPTPTRTSYTVTVPGSSSQTVTVSVYKANQTSGGLNMRKQPTGTSSVCGSLAIGDEVGKLDESGTASTGIWFKVKKLVGGATGWVYSSYLASTGKTTTISVDGSSTPSTERTLTMHKVQPFRIYAVERSSADRTVTVHAQHVTYDLANAKFSPNDSTQVSVSVADLISDYILDTTHISHLTSVVPESLLGSGTVKLALVDKNAAELLNEAVELKDAKVIRDWWKMYLVADINSEVGYEIRFGKNLLTANLKADMSEVANSIIAYSTDSGAYKASSVQEDADSIAAYGKIRRYVEHEGITSVPALDNAAKQDLAEMKNPQYTLDAEFVNLALAPQFAAYANQYGIHIYDTVMVVDTEAGINMPLRMSGYTYDCLGEKYTEVTLGQLEEE